MDVDVVAPPCMRRPATILNEAVQTSLNEAVQTSLNEAVQTSLNEAVQTSLSEAVQTRISECGLPKLCPEPEAGTPALRRVRAEGRARASARGTAGGT
jgi:hypothetical protein